MKLMQTNNTMGIWDWLKNQYTNVDKSVGGILPGGYVAPKTSTPTPVVPQKSTIISSGPTPPPMNVTAPTGNVVKSTPTVTQTASQFTPSVSSYKTTSDTGTGYNPATGVQEGKPTALPSATTVATPNSITAYQPGAQVQPALWSVGSAASQGLGIVGQDIKKIFTGNGDLKNPLSPFSHTDTKVYGGGEPYYTPSGDYRQLSRGTIMSSGFSGFRPTTTEEIGYGHLIANYGETGAIVAGSFVAPELTSGYLIGTGLGQLAKSNTGEGGLRVIAGLSYPIARAIQLPGEITQAQIEGIIGKQPNFNTGVRIDMGNGKFVDYYKSFKSTDMADMMTTTKLVITPSPNLPNAATAQGRSITTIKTTDFGSMLGNDWKDINIASAQNIRAVSVSLPKSGELIPSVSLIKTNKLIDFSSVSSKGITDSFNLKMYLPEGPANVYTVGGVSKAPTGFIQSLSGKVKYADYDAFGKPVGFGFDASDISLLKTYKSPVVEDTGKAFSQFQGGGKKSSPEFLSNMWKTSTTAPSFQSAISPTITPPLSITAPTPITSVLKSFPAITSSLGTMQIPKTTSIQRTAVVTTGQSIVMPKLDTGIKMGVITIPNLMTSVMPATKVGTATIQIPKVSQLSKTLQGTASITGSVVTSVPTFDVPTTPFSMPPIVPFLPKFDMDFGAGTRIYKGRQRKKYMPSFEAFAFGIRGKAPKGIETGARVRPITKGFSLAFNKPAYSFSGMGSNFKSPKINFNSKKFKMPRFKLRKK